MEQQLNRKEILLKIIAEIPESYREESLKALIDFAEFLKFNGNVELVKIFTT